MDPLLSVIVPVYKSEAHLQRCIDSVLHQEYKRAELIIVDDGSPDNSSDIYKAAAVKDERIKFVYKENGGIASARNKGISIASGEYITFIDADDFVHPQVYKKAMSHITENKNDLLIFDFKKVEDETKKDFEEIEDIEPRYLNRLEALNKLYSPDRSTYIYPWNKIYHQSLFNKLRYNESHTYDDEEMAHRLLHEAKSIVYFSCEGYYYVQREGSFVNVPFSMKKFKRMDALYQRCLFFKQKGYTDLHQSAVEHYVETFLWYYLLAQKLDNKEGLHQQRIQFNSLLKYILKNQLISSKQKPLLIIFRIAPSIYIHLIKVLMRQKGEAV